MWRKLSPGVYVDGRCVKPGAWEEYVTKQPGARWVPDAPVYKPGKWKPVYEPPPSVDKAALALAIAGLPDVLENTIQNIAESSSAEFVFYAASKFHYRWFHPKSPCKITKEMWSEIGDKFVMNQLYHVEADQHVLWAMAGLYRTGKQLSY